MMIKVNWSYCLPYLSQTITWGSFTQLPNLNPSTSIIEYRSCLEWDENCMHHIFYLSIAPRKVPGNYNINVLSFCLDVRLSFLTALTQIFGSWDRVSVFIYPSHPFSWHSSGTNYLTSAHAQLPTLFNLSFLSFGDCLTYLNSMESPFWILAFYKLPTKSSTY